MTRVCALPALKGASDCGTRGDAIQELDGCVGQIIDTLDHLNLAANTLLIVTSDNGGVMDDGYADGAEEDANGHRCNGTLRGFKGSLWEGGTCVPFIARWPGRIKPGTESTELVGLVDMLATFSHVAGCAVPPDAGPDSFDMLPALLGDGHGRDELVVQANGVRQVALRQGPWKFIPDPPRLFNLAADLGESHNLAADKPEMPNKLSARLQQLRTEEKSRP